MADLPNREWKLKEAGTLASGEADAAIERLRVSTGLSRLALQVCVNRGLTEVDEIKRFLSPRLDELTSPLKIRDMDRAVDRFARARETKERIRVFGDYDVDGTSGAALLTWFFRELAVTFDAVQPDRFKDGYGLGVSAVEQASTDGVQLLVTVDCGISSFDAIKRAGELGIDVIVIDHHQIDPARGLPSAHAVLNPQRADCESGLRQLCGCGVAFYFCMALRSKGRELGWFGDQPPPNLRQHLDLVVLATAADIVPLTGDNHILTRHGMEVLKQSKKPGLRAMLREAGLLQRELSPGNLGFALGPRINASGRMASASIALELLTTQDEARGAELAIQIEALNKARAETQNQIWDEVRARVETSIAQGRYQHAVVVADPGWHEGVVGIVASRVTEAFRRPAIVLHAGPEFMKGSARTYGGKDVLAAMRECASLLRGFGGHRHAAGLTVDHDRFDEFVATFDAAIGRLANDESVLPLWIEGVCAIEELEPRSLQELEQLGPFGPGNPEPVFRMRATASSQRILKERHLKLGLAQGRARPVEAIWFNAAERPDFRADAKVFQGDESEWAGVPELNRFRGEAKPSFRVRDWKRFN